MPPCDYSKYPRNWKSEIRPRILARAGQVLGEDGKVLQEAHCETCGAMNRAEGWRFPSGAFLTPEMFAGDYIEPDDERAAEKVLKRKTTKIVLTIAHLDHDPENHEVKDDRLAALCARCHLLYDKDLHMNNAAKTRRRKKGQSELFE